MFWANYVKLCSQVGKSPSAVAKECGIKSSGTVPAWKNGAIPRSSAVLAIADHFGVDPKELLNGNPDIAKKPALVSEDRLDERVQLLVNQLTDEEIGKLCSFAQGLIAARRT